jgi:GNAT superfamily N-acetyltransferase
MESSQLSIRDAALEDLDAIVDVHTQARAAYYPEAGGTEREINPPVSAEKRRQTWAALLRSDAHVLCALWADQVVGIALMAPVEPAVAETDAETETAATATATAGELHALHILRSHWGRGVGSRLHSAYVEYLQSSSMSTGELEVWDRNSRARTFYDRRGWKLDGRQRIDSDGVYLRMRLDVADLPVH